MTHQTIVLKIMASTKADLSDFCSSLEEFGDDNVEKSMLIWVLPMILIILYNLCKCSGRFLKTFVCFLYFFIIYSSIIFNAIALHNCGCCGDFFVMLYPISWSMSLAACGLSWNEWRTIVSSYTTDEDFERAYMETVLAPEEAERKMTELSQGLPRITVFISCYNQKITTSTVYDHVRHEWVTDTKIEETTTFKTTEEFHFARYEDDSSTELPTLGPGEAVKVDLKVDVEPGDEETKNEIEAWKEKLVQTHKSKGTFHTVMVTKWIGATNDREVERFLVKIGSDQKKWFARKPLLHVIGFFHLLWIVTGFIVFAVPDVKPVVKKRVFVR